MPTAIQASRPALRGKQIDGAGEAFEDDAPDLQPARHDRLEIGLVVHVEIAALGRGQFAFPAR